MPLEETKAPIRPAPDAAANGKPTAVADTPEATEVHAAAPPAVETRGARLGRKARRTRFHLVALSAVLLLVCLVALVVANTRQVELNWVFGSSTASLVWIVLFSAILGWLLGVLSSAVFHWRTRAPRA
jgi:uncharacterized integral membrane protein